MKLPPARVTIPQEDITELVGIFREILVSGRLTLGPYTEEFESAWSKWHGRRYSIAVNSGTSALEIILRCLDVSGRTVLIPTNTFFATAAAALHAGARVRFVDVARHLMVDELAVERALSPDVAAMVVVHIGGYVHPEIRRLADMCAERGIPLVEDAAHAHGSRLGSSLAGTFSVASSFSFFPTKLMTTGEGGIITTDDERIDRMARTLRDQGKARASANFHTELGYNWRMGELNAAMGLSQLRRLAGFIEHRRKAAENYSVGLRDVNGVVPMSRITGSHPNYYKYIAFLDSGRDRDSLKRRLADEFGVSLGGEVYEVPCHMQPVFQRPDVSLHGTLTNAEGLCRSHFCIPMYSDITQEEQEYALHALNGVLA